MIPLYDRLFLRETGYFGRGGFTECMITSSSILYSIALFSSSYKNLPSTIDSLVWQGFPVWALAVPAFLFAFLSVIGIAAIGRFSESRQMRTIGMVGQFGCFFAALILSVYESGFHMSVPAALEIPYTLAAIRTSILIRFRSWP